MLALQRWGSQWAELTPEHAIRAWCCGAGEPWLAAKSSVATLRSARGSGGDEDLVVVVSDPVAFARWDLGELEWSEAVRGGAVQVRGAPALARALPTWKRRLDPVQRPPAVRQPATPA